METTEQLVKKEFLEYKELSEKIGLGLKELIYTTEKSSHANKDSSISISISQIENYTKDGSAFFKKLFVQYVIGHEIAHFNHLRGYRPEVLKKATGEALVFLECQADILAGYYMSYLWAAREIRSMSQMTSEAIQAVSDERLKTMFSVLNRILLMDEENATITTHPTNKQRLIAFRQGLYLGNCNFYLSLFSNLPADDPSLKTKEVINAKNLYSDIAQGIDYKFQSGENPLFWSHWEAIRIIHENSIIARKVIMFDKKVDWDTSSNNPYVDFSFKVVNTHTAPVRFYGRIVTQIVSRKNPKNLLLIGPYKSVSFDKVVQPNSVLTIADRLEWTADPDYMPRIVLPGDAGSFYAVFDNSNPLPDLMNKPTTHFDFTNWTSASINESNDLINYLIGENKKNGLFSFAMGIGHSLASNRDDLDKKSIEYEPVIDIKSSGESKVYLYGNKSFVAFKVPLFSSENKSLVEKLFKELNQEVQSSLPLYVPQERMVRNRDIIQEYYFTEELALRTQVKYDYIHQEYKLLVEVFGDN